MAHNWHAITSANLSYFNSFDYIVIVQLSVFFSHRSHIVSGLYALSDLRASPSPRLVSLLKRTLPVYSTNDVRGKQLIFSINPSPILPIIQLYQDIYNVFCLSPSFYSDRCCRRRKNNYWRYGSKKWSYPFYWQSTTLESFHFFL